MYLLAKIEIDFFVANYYVKEHSRNIEALRVELKTS